MANFCGKCGSATDPNTGLCPNCDSDKLNAVLLDDEKTQSGFGGEIPVEPAPVYTPDEEKAQSDFGGEVPVAEPQAPAAEPVAAAFCRKCGAQRNADGLCPNCDVAPAPVKSFCKRCGTPIDPATGLCLACEVAPQPAEYPISEPIPCTVRPILRKKIGLGRKVLSALLGVLFFISTLVGLFAIYINNSISDELFEAALGSDYIEEFEDSFDEIFVDADREIKDDFGVTEKELRELAIDDFYKPFLILEVKLFIADLSTGDAEMVATREELNEFLDDNQRKIERKYDTELTEANKLEIVNFILGEDNDEYEIMELSTAALSDIPVLGAIVGLLFVSGTIFMFLGAALVLFALMLLVNIPKGLRNFGIIMLVHAALGGLFFGLLKTIFSSIEFDIDISSVSDVLVSKNLFVVIIMAGLGVAALITRFVIVRVFSKKA